MIKILDPRNISRKKCHNGTINLKNYGIILQSIYDYGQNIIENFFPIIMVPTLIQIFDKKLIFNKTKRF